jgi:hypothetical protein
MLGQTSLSSKVCAHFPTKETNAIGRLTQRTVAHARGWVDPSVQQDLDDFLGDAQIYAECFRKMRMN